jgi:hypothetical protein
VKLKKGIKVYQGGREFTGSIPKAVQEDIKAGLAKKAERIKKEGSSQKAKTLGDIEYKAPPKEQAVKQEKSGGK